MSSREDEEEEKEKEKEEEEAEEQEQEQKGLSSINTFVAHAVCKSPLFCFVN